MEKANTWIPQLYESIKADTLLEYFDNMFADDIIRKLERVFFHFKDTDILRLPFDLSDVRLKKDKMNVAGGVETQMGNVKIEAGTKLSKMRGHLVLELRRMMRHLQDLQEAEAGKTKVLHFKEFWKMVWVSIQTKLFLILRTAAEPFSFPLWEEFFEE